MRYFFLLISLSKPVTERALDSSEILILLCGLILAIGAAGEYIEEHGTLFEWMKWSRRPKMVFVWMVALSLVGEFVGDAGVFVFSGHLQTINDGEYAALNKEAARLRKQAEDEAMARVEIEDRVAWRKLSDKQQLEINTRLIRFSGQYVTVMYTPRDDQEAGLFSSDIKHVLGMAMWDTTAPQMRGDNPAGGILASAPASIDTGVTVERTDDAASKRSSRALCDELIRNGFDCRVSPKFLGQFKPVVWVTVEHRPEGPQGEGKLRPQRTKKP